MTKLLLLGPKGTYCDIAATLLDNEYSLEYFPSITKVLNNVSDSGYALVPFENTLDGFVLESLDGIIDNNLKIISEVKLPIDFVFVSKTKSINEVKYVYTQFKVYGQCLDFISSNNFDVIRTESNTLTLNNYNESSSEYAAIIPIHLKDKAMYNFSLDHVQDSLENETRFVLVRKNGQYSEFESTFLASLVITTKEDKPGVLYDILDEFHKLDINLNSILSRPLRTKMGKYKFYIECLLDNKKDYLDGLSINLSKQGFDVTILGKYNKL